MTFEIWPDLSPHFFAGARMRILPANVGADMEEGGELQTMERPSNRGLHVYKVILTLSLDNEHLHVDT